MDKAVIFGVYEFVGFQLCKKLLEQGIEVQGMIVDPGGEEWLEEKRMEIGRNSNFTEMDITEWENRDGAYVIANFYDFFMKEKEGLFFDPKYREILYSGKGDTLFLLPVIILEDKQFAPISSKLFSFINEARANGAKCREFFLPTIYGPWQTDLFSFQQILLNKTEEISDREWTYDAIYVDDAVEAVIKFMECEEERILLKNETGNRWAEWVNMIKGNNNLTDLNKIGRTESSFYPAVEKFVKEKLSLNEAIERQRKHNELRARFKL